ncbi:hypothetical protein EDC14_101614 [Hydrogenispora ethanolica]|jgi:uncharacterized protein YcaQ|uniref:Winged helix-turn-helix domain-containing protein n=1 Tax=Hydrogenispora ethanolica TaxID=1082276 RepID=A0A4R1RIG4_HYDET|nr:winged helix DNA-binding domain-containing protein [Hydrogenispora ethanolica]TCL65884.1 hypothetical protein EDC14_101614 [Hydrogenispora ethanolica]
MNKLQWTKEEARRFILAHQGLWPPARLAGKNGILEYIRRVGCIQFDPLDMVGRNPELVLQARLADFRPEMLGELLYQERKLLDGWDKMMSIYSVTDWPFFRRQREADREKCLKRCPELVEVLPLVRRAITERGPLSSLDLDYNESVDWPWAPTRLSRAALESMYFWGELIIHHKVHTRKVYDFASRHLPGELLAAADPNRTSEQYRDWHLLRRIGGIGLVWNKSGDAWLGIPGTQAAERNAAISRLLRKKQLLEVAVAGIATPCFIRTEDWQRLEGTFRLDSPGQGAILAPLDNLLWERRLLKELFEFDYRWEVYKPVAERLYGYYVLPVLHGERFVARCEPVRDKSERLLVMKNWWWEPEVTDLEQVKKDLAECFKRFMQYLDVVAVRIDEELSEREGLEWLAGLKLSQNQ